MENKKRILYLDIIRIIACVMVIVQHSPMPDLGTNSILLSSTSFLTYPCIGLFFMVSGSLLLPVRQSSVDFYKKRVTKIVFPTIIWMFIYLLIGFILHQFDIEFLFKRILLIPLMPVGVPVFWFIYVLIGLYLFAPIISPWLLTASKKELKFFLILWGCSLFIPIFNGYVDITYGYYSILCYFGGYLGYFIFGYYLHHFKVKLPYVYSILLILIPILLYTFCKHIGMKYNLHTYYYLSLFSASMTAGWFTLLKSLFENCKIDDIFNKYIISFSNACFGIYLVHIFVMRNILWKIDFISSYGGFNQILTTSFLTLLFSYLLVYFLSKLPYSKFLIGY